MIENVYLQHHSMPWAGNETGVHFDVRAPHHITCNEEADKEIQSEECIDAGRSWCTKSRANLLSSIS
jgi:hypothetical protein